MEYAKDMIFNLGYRRIWKIKELFNSFRLISKRVKIISLTIFSFIKKCTSYIFNIIRKNKIISIALFMLTVLIIADLILVDIFMKIFATLY